MKNFNFIDWFGLFGIGFMFSTSWFDNEPLNRTGYLIGSIVLLIWVVHTLLWTSKMRKQVEREQKELEEWKRNKK